MDSEYKVGALCDFIASKGIKKKITNNENIGCQLDSETSLKLKKKRSKKNSNELPVIKKKKYIESSSISPQNKIITVDTKSEINHEDNEQPTNNSESLLILGKNKIKRKLCKDKKKKKNECNTFKESNIIEIKTLNDKSKTKYFAPNMEFSEEEKFENESRTIFVGNVPVNVKMSAIKKLFKTFGEIETTRLRSVAVNNLNVPKRVSIMKGDFHSLRDTANVYVRFKTIEQAKSALVLNATKFEGKTIRVDMALNSSHKQDKKKGIFIGNLPFDVQEDEIWNFFKDCGQISAVRIIRDNATCVSKGFGYVNFEAKESVELAIRLQGKKLKNREIRIKRIENQNTQKQTFIKKPIQFKKIKPIDKNRQNFQGETLKPKIQKKKQKLTKTDLLRKKIAKKLNV